MQGARECTLGRKDERSAVGRGQHHPLVGVERLLWLRGTVRGGRTSGGLPLPSASATARPLPLREAKLQLRLLRVGPTLTRAPPCEPGRLAAVLFMGASVTGPFPTAWA